MSEVKASRLDVPTLLSVQRCERAQVHELWDAAAQVSIVTADTLFARLPATADEKCCKCDRLATFIVMTEARPTYCAVHFALVAARASGMLA